MYNLAKKFCSFFVTASLCASVLFGASLPGNTISHADTKPPEIEAAAAVLMDAGTGEILYSKDPHTQYEPASTTKMLTAILVIENLDLNKKITIVEDDLDLPGAKIPFAVGEKIKVLELLYAMMLNSANNCAYVLGKAVAGSNDKFVAMMNEKAAKIGAENTVFKNPHGLPEEGHLSTAYDLAIIAKYCMRNEQFARIVRTKKHTIPPTDMFDEPRELQNTNRLLFDETNAVNVNGKDRAYKYEGITGIKTGSTDFEHGSLVASANRKGTKLIAVSLAGTEVGRFADCIKLLDYGFKKYYSHKVISKKEFDKKTHKVIGGKDGKVRMMIAEDVYVTLPKEASKDIVKIKYDLPKKVKAPIKKGQKIGVLKIYESDMLTDEVNIFAAEAVGKGGPLSKLGISDKVAIKIASALGILLLLFIILFTIRAVNVKKARKRRAARRRQELLRIARERKEKEDYYRRRNWPTDRFK